MNPLTAHADAVSIVVSSCDRFFDVWQPFAFFFRKFWPDCPFPVYLVVNELRVESSVVRPIRVGRDKGWASNMQVALAQIRTPYILYFQEDYFLTDEVRRAQLAADISYAVEHDAASFCFFDLSLLEPDFREKNDRFGVVPDDSKGRTRLQTALWKREVFASLLRPGETAWNMEARGSERTRGVLMLSYARDDVAPIPYLMSAIMRGLWTREALALCHEHGVRMNRTFRSLDPGTKRSRRFRRAIDRVRFPLALAWQRGKAVDLDAAD